MAEIRDRVAIYETRNGDWLVEIWYNRTSRNYELYFPMDNTGPVVIPFERLEQLKSALDDTIWNKNRYTHIPDKAS